MNSKNTFYDEVYRMLGEGKSMTQIAQTITDALNQAQNEYNEVRKAEKLKEEKLALIGQIYDLCDKYMTTYAPDIKPDKEPREEGIAQVYKGMEEFVRLMREAQAENKVEAKPKAPQSKVVWKTADDAINDFLKEIGF